MLGEIGFVGLGHMGAAMAANLAAAGLQVIAYVRRPDQIGELEASVLGPRRISVTCSTANVVISMLPDDDAVQRSRIRSTGHASTVWRRV